MSDTTPQRLNAIKRLAYLPAYQLAGMDIVRDLLAMIDALEAQIRDLTKPEEDIPPGWAPCYRCRRETVQCGFAAPLCQACTVKQFEERFAEHQKQARASDPNPNHSVRLP